jgi:predicted TIM-barrel fold metal-dependent hydrolase
VGWAPFGKKECAAVLDAQCKSPLFRGVRAKPVTAPRPEQAKAMYGQPRTLQDKRWLEGLALLEERRLSWDLRVPAWHLKDAAIALEAVPELRVVLNHTGLPWDRSKAGLQTWREGMHRLADNPNVCVKLSELGSPWYPWRREDNLPLLCEALTIFGPERCLYASNFPVSGLQVSYADWLALVEEAIAQTYPQARDAVLFRNACYWYRLNV